MSSSLRLKFELGTKFAPAYLLTEVEIDGAIGLAEVRNTERDAEGNETSVHYRGLTSVLVEALRDTGHGFNTDVRDTFVQLPTGQSGETKGFLIPTSWVQIILIYCESTSPREPNLVEIINELRKSLPPLRPVETMEDLGPDIPLPRR